MALSILRKRRQRERYLKVLYLGMRVKSVSFHLESVPEVGELGKKGEVNVPEQRF